VTIVAYPEWNSLKTNFEFEFWLDRTTNYTEIEHWYNEYIEKSENKDLALLIACSSLSCGLFIICLPFIWCCCSYCNRDENSENQVGTELANSTEHDPTLNSVKNNYQNQNQYQKDNQNYNYHYQQQNATND
jgi:hypothetical protein